MFIVIESTILKSKKTALATILPPKVLGIEPNDFLPSEVSQSYFKSSSERLTIGMLSSTRIHKSICSLCNFKAKK